MNHRHPFAIIPLLIIIGVLYFVHLAQAVTVHSGDQLQIEFMGENETRVITGRNVELTGEQNGDVYVFAGSLVSKAVIHGDLIVFAGETLVTGDVIGNIRGAAGNFTLNAKARNVTVAGGKLAVGEKTVAQDIFTVAGESSIQGTAKNLHIGGERILLNAQIQENAVLAGKTITFGPASNISGNLLVKSKTTPQGFDTAQVIGKREWKEIKAREHSINLFDIILKIFSLLALVYVLWALPGVKNAVATFQPNPKSILLPLSLAILIPIAMIILLVTMIGIPLALLLGLLALAGILVSKSLAVIYLGSALSTAQGHNIHLTLVLVSLLAVLLGFIPFIGWITSFLLCLLGWALAVHVFKTLISHQK